MTQKEFISGFVLAYPRLYIRMISHCMCLTEMNLQRYSHVYEWNSLGITGNPEIKWNDGLVLKYRNRLGKDFKIDKPKLREQVIYPNKKFKIRLYTNPHEKNFLLSDELSPQTLTLFKDYINDWEKIYLEYDKIDYEFISKYYAHKHFTLILSNSSVCWDDVRIYSYFDPYQILKNYSNVWHGFMKKYVNNSTLHDHLTALNTLDKYIQVNWKSDPFNGSFKYLFSVYVYINQNKQDKVMITTGPCLSKHDLKIGDIIPLDRKMEFPIKSEFWFHFKSEI